MLWFIYSQACFSCVYLDTNVMWIRLTLQENGGIVELDRQDPVSWNDSFVDLFFRGRFFLFFNSVERIDTNKVED